MIPGVNDASRGVTRAMLEGWVCQLVGLIRLGASTSESNQTKLV